ncbi:unnamed protein product, partial [Ectocarpus sp. 8 AP-2014]
FFVAAFLCAAGIREDGFDPDVWTYSNLIRCLADSMLWRRAVGILDDMVLEGRVQPDAHCFNAAVLACSKVHSPSLFRTLIKRRLPAFGTKKGAP